MPTVTEDKNAHLRPSKGAGKGRAAAAGRWVRVSEYQNRRWFDGECATFGVCAATLREKLQENR